MVVISMMGIGFWENHFYFGHWHHRKETDKKQEEYREDPKSTEVSEDIYNRRGIITPTGRHEVIGQGGTSDNKPLEPHPHVDED
jgi:hypothetical protein